jgi:cysteine desulfurase
MQVYADHGSACPVDEEVIQIINRYMREDYGNPSSTHTHGQNAKTVLYESKAKVAEFINAEQPDEVIFTSGATESNNLALRGVAQRNKNKGKHVIISAIEHISIINIAKELTKQGFEVTKIPVNSEGLVNPADVEAAIRDDTILISIMHANTEIGTIQPIEEIGKIAEEKEIYFHTDATASCGKIPIDVQRSHIDLLTLSSNDLYGPKGTGALYIKSGTRIQPLIIGGGQERGLRSGSENIPNIAGMAKACEVAKRTLTSEAERQSRLRDQLIEGVLANIDKSYLTGHRTQRLPNNASFRFDYIEGESIILSLDMVGIAAASGSACTSKTLEPSHTLLALGLKHEQAHGSLLFTLGRENTKEHIDYILEQLPPIIERLRKLSPLTPAE